MSRWYNDVDGGSRNDNTLPQVTFEVSVDRVLDNDAVWSITSCVTADGDQSNEVRMLETT